MYWRLRSSVYRTWFLNMSLNVVAHMWDSLSLFVVRRNALNLVLRTYSITKCWSLLILLLHLVLYYCLIFLNNSIQECNQSLVGFVLDLNLNDQKPIDYPLYKIDFIAFFGCHAWNCFPFKLISLSLSLFSPEIWGIQ